MKSVMTLLMYELLESPPKGRSKNNFMAEQVQTCSSLAKVKVQNALYPVSIFPKNVNSYTSQPVRMQARRSLEALTIPFHA